LNDKELKDLQLFGNNIDKEPEIKKEKIKNYESEYGKIKTFNNSKKKKVVKILIKYFLKLSSFFYVCMKKITIFLFLILKKSYCNFRNWNNKKRYYSKKNLKNRKKVFRLVETCKKRRNKTIIIRKRVLAPIQQKNFIYNNADLNGLFYVSLNNDEHGNNKTKPESYVILKESVWDFPINSNKKRKKYF